jgi:hypothetical protein
MMRTVICVGMAVATTAVAPPRLLGARTAIIAGTVIYQRRSDAEHRLRGAIVARHVSRAVALALQ